MLSQKCIRLKRYTPSLEELDSEVLEDVELISEELLSSETETVLNVSDVEIVEVGSEEVSVNSEEVEALLSDESDVPVCADVSELKVVDISLVSEDVTEETVEEDSDVVCVKIIVGDSVEIAVVSETDFVDMPKKF